VPPLILASTSRYRQAELARLGAPFIAVAPAIDEEAEKDPQLSPEKLALHLAKRKAESLVPAHPGAVIIGGDQLVDFEGQILGKPGSEARAIEQLLAMRGKAHRLLTALVVIAGGRTIQHLDVTTLTLRDLDRAAIERYVAFDRPIDCAGSYKLESRGIALFEAIDGVDASAIVGLPLMALTKILSGLGYSIP
jgi:septum formation protein